jgi:hypothetical protein
VRLKRIQKEAEKREELRERKDYEISEKANKQRREDAKTKEAGQKALMREIAARGRKSIKMKKRSSEGDISTRRLEVPMQELQEVTEQVKRKTHKVLIVKRKGERKIPKATDEHGCAHTGLLGLIALPKKYLKAYVKAGGWLYKKPCRDCAEKEQEKKGKERCWMCQVY